MQLTLHICMRKIALNQLVEAGQDQLLTLEQTARAQAESANYRSNQLLKIANNEFRTALELIQAWTQQIQNGQLDAVATAWAVRSIERQVKLLLQLIEDLQDVSEMISHNRALQTSQIDLLMQQMERQMAAANTSFDSTHLAATAPAPVLDGLQVLLIDDEADARELIAAVLEQYGISVIAATSVAEALAVLKRSRPDVLISDIRMPDEDGYALIRKVRMLEAEKGWHIPAIALTAYLDEERASALAAGFQSHLHKFTPPTQLVAMVAQLAGQA